MMTTNKWIADGDAMLLRINNSRLLFKVDTLMYATLCQTNWYIAVRNKAPVSSTDGSSMADTIVAMLGLPAAKYYHINGDTRDFTSKNLAIRYSKSEEKLVVFSKAIAYLLGKGYRLETTGACALVFVKGDFADMKNTYVVKLTYTGAFSYSPNTPPEVAQYLKTHQVDEG